MMAAINIVLLIGRIVLYILLGLLCLLVFLLLVPIFYSVEAELNEANRHPKDFKNATYKVCVCGIPVINSKRKKKIKKSSKNHKVDAEAQQIAADADTPMSEVPEDENKKKEASSKNRKGTKSTAKNKKKKTGKVKKILDLVRSAFSDENKELMSLIKDESFYLLKHFGPRCGKMTLHYNLADPSNTGLLTAALSMIPLFYKKGVRVYPDFENEELYLYGKMRIGGHIRIIHGVRSAIHIFMNKRFRQLLRKGVKKNVRE